MTEMKVDLRLTDKLSEQKYYDSHGGAIIDIDGDGFLDIFLNGGGGRGYGVGREYAPCLYWGSKNLGDIEWSGGGGQSTALRAGLGNRGGSGRGRGVYFADFNQDGKLDVLLVNVEMKKRIAPTPFSQILYNQGNRKFKTDPNFREYISLPILAGRGKAVFEVQDSLIVQRSQCSKEISGSFCATHPEGSWAEYRFSPKTKNMEMVRSSKAIADFERTSVAATADFDGDGIYDLFFSSKNGIGFIYSKQTRNLSHRFANGFSEKIKVPSSLPSSYQLQRAIPLDYDLDGSLDIIAIYMNSAKYATAIYSIDNKKKQPPYW
eukprot:CAMPEP_0194284500 /NCGR_PEP_ID=MMETSP0169-20130528/27745_1 /TAXON_ID=218684 /ORGANISM="Corethron pennatum, Strain L29A3" /LENGTH=319 /DNA_ID=CAMNT_0039030335 /DNA_START=572 /DNA_END=1528 /DNA_ORIENTATION=+